MTWLILIYDTTFMTGTKEIKLNVAILFKCSIVILEWLLDASYLAGLLPISHGSTFCNTNPSRVWSCITSIANYPAYKDLA